MCLIAQHYSVCTEQYGSLDSMERWNGTEWWNGIVERWNSGMVEPPHTLRLCLCKRTAWQDVHPQ